MRLLVVSHKECWPSASSQSGYATDGGFPFQMRALSELFDKTTLVVPCRTRTSHTGEGPLTGHNLVVVPLSSPSGNGVWRKLGMLFWLVESGWDLVRQVRSADAVHAPIPGDVGTIGMLLAFVLHKPLFVRHCGNWFVQRTAAEHFWKWFMEKYAGGRNVMLATGGNSGTPPSARNQNVRWIFSTTLTKQELEECLTPRKEVDDRNVRLIIVCRQEKEKGTGELIASLPALLQDFPQLTLDVVGDGDALVEFRTSAEVLGVGKQVVFHGKVDHKRVIARLQQASLFCYPTRASEGFPKVVLEALACGLPVVTTRVSVLPELIEQGCGLLLDGTSPADIRLAIREIMSDQQLYQSMSARAIQTARQYSLEEWRDTIADHLKTTWARSLSSSSLTSSCAPLN
jgi:glycosyltransferase involved in cell wall biosynthesis